MATFQEKIREAEAIDDEQEDQELLLLVRIGTMGKLSQAWKAALNLHRREAVASRGLVRLMTPLEDDMWENWEDSVIELLDDEKPA